MNCKQHFAQAHAQPWQGYFHYIKCHHIRKRIINQNMHCTKKRFLFHSMLQGVSCSWRMLYSEIVALCCFCVFCLIPIVAKMMLLLTCRYLQCRSLFFPMPIDNNSWWVGLDNSSSGSKKMPPGVPSYPAAAARSVVGWGWSHHHQTTWSSFPNIGKHDYLVCELYGVLQDLKEWPSNIK